MLVNRGADPFVVDDAAHGRAALARARRARGRGRVPHARARGAARTTRERGELLAELGFAEGCIDGARVGRAPRSRRSS